MITALAFLFALITSSALASSEPPPTTIGSGMAVEGDVLSVNGAIVRLWGVDAPDVGQTCKTRRSKEYDCFTFSKNALNNIVREKQIICYIKGQDRNGQKIGICAVNGYDVAALMVRAGWALSYDGLSTQYASLMGNAQAKERGLWGGRVEPPWQWRTRKQAEDAKKKR